MGNKQARGYRTKVVAYEQDTLSQIPDPADGHRLFFRTFGVRGQQDLEESETLRGVRGRAEPDLGNKNVAGPMVGEVDAANIGLLLKHLFGEVSTTGAGPYEHEFTVNQEGFEKSLLLEKDHGSVISGSGRVERYLGCRVSTAEFNLPRNGYPTINWDFLGAAHTLNETPLDTDPTDTGFTPFTAFRAGLQMNDQPLANITELRATLSNDLDDDQYVVGGEGERVDIPEGWFLVSGQITARFTSADLLQKAIDGDTVRIVASLSRGDGSGSAGNEFFELDLEKLRFQRNSPEIDGPRGVQITLDFQGFQDGSALAKAVLKNQVESY
ncbi:phage tail tube protein [Natronospira bacteriovora]|uniref:Phage tail tube protein n=1 Tax=Natronospira bacteriovora TaxID=3069753 RepID=A0ABU0W5S8_9GAMM|nr:phage tail tube protein [Natronospira sp. AB-CW4]MDQ2069317.1 phage tail tube protein [Natronospira sp. AB-CW4]